MSEVDRRKARPLERLCFPLLSPCVSSTFTMTDVSTAIDTSDDQPPYHTPPNDGSSPIKTLPLDLLTQIFEDLVTSSYDFGHRRITFVCRQWRAVGTASWERHLQLLDHENDGITWLEHIKRTRDVGQKVVVRSLSYQGVKEIPEELDAMEGVETLVLGNFSPDETNELTHPAFSGLTTLVLPNVYPASHPRSPMAPHSAPLPPIKRLVLGRLNDPQDLHITTLLFPTLTSLVLHSPFVTSDLVVLSPETTPALTHLTCPIAAFSLFDEETAACPALRVLTVAVTATEELADFLDEWTQMIGWPALRTLERFLLTPGNDLDVLNFALALEFVDVSLFSGALANFSEQDFASAGFPVGARQTVQRIAEDEQAHAAIIRAAILDAGGTPVVPCRYSFLISLDRPAYNDVKGFIGLSSVIEGVGTSAYIGAVSAFEEPKHVTAAATILGAETRHNALLRYLNSESPNPAPQDTPLSATAVTSLASG
ncbi:hypothetical protein P7C70_g544, partial [Phenoliferia sp. Uapishka_3]